MQTKLEAVSLSHERSVLSLTDSNPFLELQITIEEVIKSLNKCKNNKTPGSDNISFEFLKNLPENFRKYLTYLFNRLMDKEEVPSSWSKILLRMIYKKEDKNNPANFRPIALVNSVTKTFTRVIMGRLSSWVKERSLLGEWQAGFRKNRSCTDHIFTLNAIIQIRLSLNRGKLFVLFVDFRSAFPSVSPDIMWEKNYKLGIGKKIIGVLKNLYTIATMSVMGREGVSEPVEIKGGV